MNLEMSYPYSGSFQRPIGTGGISELGIGCFAIKEPPFPLETVKPDDYYLYDGDILEEMIQKQIAGIRSSIKYLHSIREEYMNQE